MAELTCVADLKPASYNPREIGEQALAGLAVSLKEFGDISGIVWNERTGNLVCGHQRVKALQEEHGDALSIAHVAPDYYELRAPGRKAYRIRVVEWDLAFEKAANVAANSQLLAGDFTSELVDVIEDIKIELPELSDSLFFDELASGAPVNAELKDGLTDPDAVPEPLPEPVARTGDLWLLGEHRVLCGDSTKAEDVVRLMAGDVAGLMNTDPPYGVAYANDERPNPGVAKPRVANDTLADEELQAFLEGAFSAAREFALAINAAWYTWHAHLTQGYFAAAAAAAAVILHRQIIWVKPVLLLGRGQYHWKHEPCFMGWVKGHQPPDYGEGAGERTQTTVWEVGSVTQAERREFNHSSPKPVGLFTIPITKHLKPGEVAYEPFAGSGPQVIACEQLGRRCYAMEIDPRYVSVTVRRWQEFTGEEATLDGDGRTFAEIAKERYDAQGR